MKKQHPKIYRKIMKKLSQNDVKMGPRISRIFPEALLWSCFGLALVLLGLALVLLWSLGDPGDPKGISKTPKKGPRGPQKKGTQRTPK